MALTVALGYTAEAINGTSFTGTITDNTVYGGANPLRSAVAVYLTIYKVDQSGVVEYQVTPTAYTPSSATTFTFPVIKDGYYKFKYAIINNYSGAVDYAQYDSVYLSSVVYQAFANPPIATSPPNASYWTVVPDPTTLLDLVGTSTASGNLSYQLFEQVIYPFSKVGFGDASETAALECCSDCERGEDVKNYEQMGVFVDGMFQCNARGKYLKGEKIARKSEELIATF